jgi:calcineurin-like phosphoesterase family protein
VTAVFFWSDLHIRHGLVAADRGFATTADHDEAIAEAWIETVTKRDSVWLLGDNASSNPAPALDLLAKLPGTKHLVAGNHDPVHPLYPDSHRFQRRYMDVFSSVQIAGQRRLGTHTALLSHFPYEGDGPDRADRYSQWRLRDEGRWLIHGHVHQAWKIKGRQINVGVDHWDRPVASHELDRLIDACTTSNQTGAS